MTIAEPSPVFRLHSGRVNARAQVRNGQFVVLAGSEALAEGTAAFAENAFAKKYRGIHQRLLASSELVSSPTPTLLTFAHDVVFDAAMDATIVILQNPTVPSSLWVTQDSDGQRLTFGGWRQSRNAEQAGMRGCLPAFSVVWYAPCQRNSS